MLYSAFPRLSIRDLLFDTHAQIQFQLHQQSIVTMMMMMMMIITAIQYLEIKLLKYTC